MLVERLRELSPWSHTRFQGWCVSAVVGELPSELLTELEKHIRKCGKCREFLENTAQRNLQAMPAFWDNPKVTIGAMPPEGMRTRFLQRLKRQRSEPEEALPVVEWELPIGERLTIDGPAGVKPDSPPRGRFGVLMRPAPIGPLLIAVGLFVGGYYTGSWLKEKDAPAGNINREAQSEIAQTSKSADNSLEIKEKLLQSVLADSAKEQATAKAERQALEERLAASEAGLMSLQKENATALQLSEAAEHEAQAALTESRKENEGLRKRIADADGTLATQERRTQELRNELEITRGQLQEREEQRAAADQQIAKGQLGEMVTARNLHIVDVYDAAGGQRKPSFGRVFYVEGKSLLFYAYDLQDAKQAKANVVFHVWGGRAGTKEVTHSLGILRNDDAKQGLWTMTFDDSAVLAQINSVFVTAEAANQRGLAPRGKKILYAYLGNPPNHP